MIEILDELYRFMYKCYYLYIHTEQFQVVINAFEQSVNTRTNHNVKFY